MGVRPRRLGRCISAYRYRKARCQGEGITDRTFVVHLHQQLRTHLLHAQTQVRDVFTLNSHTPSQIEFLPPIGPAQSKHNLWRKGCVAAPGHGWRNGTGGGGKG